MKQRSIVKLAILGVGILLFSISSCKKEDADSGSGGGSQTDDPITLSCNDFSGDVVLENNPNASIDYIIDCKVTVKQSITIEEGTVIQFTSGAGIRVTDGLIKCNGTANSRIVMKGKNGVAGDWLGIMIDSDNNGNIIEYTDILDAGGGSFNSNGDIASLLLWGSARLTLKNCLISNGEESGINCSYGGIKLVNENNIITKCKQPAKMLFPLVGQLSITNTYTDNAEDVIEIGATTASDEDVVLKNMGVDFYLSAYKQGVKNYRITNNLGLIIEAGVTIFSAPGVYINVDDGAYISINGTSTKPVKLYGRSPVSGFWEGIRIQTGNPLNKINYVDIKHAGSDNVYDNAKAAISMWYDHRLEITNSSISQTDGFAINRGTSVGSGNLVETNNDFNGLAINEF